MNSASAGVGRRLRTPSITQPAFALRDYPITLDKLLNRMPDQVPSDQRPIS